MMYELDHSKRRQSEQVISNLIHYPDGISRILTMPLYQWDWIQVAEKNGYAFNDILVQVLGLAKDFPSGKGEHFDILDATRYMLLTIVDMIYAEQKNLANDRL